MFNSSSTIKLCAWSKDTDTCQGDSGGPLTVPENGQICFSMKTLRANDYANNTAGNCGFIWCKVYTVNALLNFAAV